MALSDKDRQELRYDFSCKVNTVFQFLDMFMVINGERCVYTALERFLDERGFMIVKYDKKHM